MSAIQILPELLVSQIAAGEVVERPASVLKELIENSIDAGAQAIAVTLDEGGMRRVQVEDDGEGIAREELPLALARHATSKVRDLADLESVATMGFRGEALASIASVSRLSITSRRKEAAHGALITAEGAQIGEVAPAARAPGTTVSVADLYFNTPARRKFLRTEATEYAHCDDAFSRVALARCGIGFTLRHNGRVSRHLRAQTLSERAAALLGGDFLAASVPIDARGGALALTGLAGTPQAAKPRADAQYFFVNARFVRDRVLAHAVREAYSQLLHGDRQPAYVLLLELDPRLVDVNVHPAKTEVRFRDSRAVHQFVKHALERALAGTAAQAPVSYATLNPPFASLAPPFTGGQRQSAFALAQSPAAYQAFMGSALPLPAADKAPPLGYALGQLHGVYILAQNEVRAGAGRHARRARAHRDGEAEEEPRCGRGAAPDAARPGRLLCGGARRRHGGGERRAARAPGARGRGVRTERALGARGAGGARGRRYRGDSLATCCARSANSEVAQSSPRARTSSSPPWPATPRCARTAP